MTQSGISHRQVFLSLNYYFYLVIAAIRIHLCRCRQYWADVLVWIASIWLTIAIQAVFIYVLFKLSGGQFFGYSQNDLIIFFGVALLATGIAQILIHGVVLHLANSVWSGQFDYWLVHPPNIFARMIVEDFGIAWFWPHVVVGSFITFYFLPASQLLMGLLVVLLAAIFEVCWIFCFCIPAIKWGRWNPNEGLWEYLESARSIPLLRTKNTLLCVISCGVLQYSLAIEVLTGKLSILYFVAIVGFAILVTVLFLRGLINTYTSASS